MITSIAPNARQIFTSSRTSSSYWPPPTTSRTLYAPCDNGFERNSAGACVGKHKTGIFFLNNVNFSDFLIKISTSAMCVKEFANETIDASIQTVMAVFVA